MTVLLYLLAAWLVVAVVASLIVGRGIRLADEQSEAERAASMRRHPSGRGAA